MEGCRENGRGRRVRALNESLGMECARARALVYARRPGLREACVSNRYISARAQHSRPEAMCVRVVYSNDGVFVCLLAMGRASRYEFIFVGASEVAGRRLICEDECLVCLCFMPAANIS